jgi:hypothetical protein
MLLLTLCLLVVDRLVQSRSCSTVPSLSIAFKLVLAKDRSRIADLVQTIKHLIEVDQSLPFPDFQTIISAPHLSKTYML